MTKILYVFGGEKASGAELVIDRLVRYNAKEVNAYLFISPGKFSQNIINSNHPYKEIITLDELKKLNRISANKVTFYLRALSNYLKLSIKVMQYVRKHDIKVVHANTIVPASYLIPAIWYTRLFKRGSIRFLWSNHDMKYHSGIDHKLSAYCCRLFDCTLVVSEAVGRVYQDQSKVKVLYNGLDIEVFRPDQLLRDSFRSRNGISGKDTVLAMVASIEPRKGPLALIKVFERLLKANSNIKLVLAGSISADHPEYAAEVADLVNSLPEVTHLGIVTDMQSFYNGCDIIINNSTAIGKEALGTAIYEAMATEKIVVAAAVGGTPEIISDNYDGYLFEPDNEHDLYNKLDYVIRNIGNLETVRKHARKKVLEKFDIRQMSNNYNRIVSEILAEH